jgi:hypothetical protein
VETITNLDNALLKIEFITKQIIYEWHNLFTSTDKYDCLSRLQEKIVYEKKSTLFTSLLKSQDNATFCDKQASTCSSVMALFTIIEKNYKPL